MKTYLKMIEGQQECVVAFAETHFLLTCYFGPAAALISDIGSLCNVL